MHRVTGSREPCLLKTYFCEDHEFETVTKSKTFEYERKKYKRRYVLTGMMLGAGMKSSAVDYNTASASKGIARDRSLHKKIAAVSSKMISPSVYVHMEAVHTSLLHELESKGDGDREISDKIKHDQLEMLQSDLATTKIALQQVAEQTCTSNVPINPSVREVAGMGLEIGNAASVHVQKRRFVHGDLVKKQYVRAYDKEPLAHLGTSNSEVKRRTGFTSQEAMLSYIFVVCNGDGNIIKRCMSSLTWYEEWF